MSLILDNFADSTILDEEKSDDGVSILVESKFTEDGSLLSQEVKTNVSPKTDRQEILNIKDFLMNMDIAYLLITSNLYKENTHREWHLIYLQFIFVVKDNNKYYGQPHFFAKKYSEDTHSPVFKIRITATGGILF